MAGSSRFTTILDANVLSPQLLRDTLLSLAVARLPPDIFRLRYRQALSEVVAAVVRADEAATPATISARTPPAVAEADKAHFIELVLAEFKALHAGNTVRFGIGALALAAWRERHG